MISDTRMWYGSAVVRHGRSRPFMSYQWSSLRRNTRRAAGGGPATPFFLRGIRILNPMKIYTRTGDRGETGLFGGARVSKSHPRVAAYGDVDELNACLGVVGAQSDVPAEVAADLLEIQKDLFAIGARLADPDAKGR